MRKESDGQGQYTRPCVFQLCASSSSSESVFVGLVGTSDDYLEYVTLHSIQCCRIDDSVFVRLESGASANCTCFE